MEKFKKLLQFCIDQRASDLHVAANHPAVVRKDGQVYHQKDIVWSGKELDKLINALLEDRHKKILREQWSADFSKNILNANMRVNVVTTYRGLSMSIRFLPGVIPTVENLNLHPSLSDLCNTRSGLILFCGATGSGKTSTIAAMLNQINRTRAAHILTLEDPIEYRFSSQKSFVEQRELGLHFLNFEQALVDSLREMPDVILVGELREPEIMRQTLNIAESGHLILGTLHASTPEEAVYRIVNSFPFEAQELIRFQLAATLQAVIVQRLETLEKAGFRVPHLSILRGSQALRTTLRDNKLNLIESIIDMGVADEMYSFRRYKEEYLNKRESFMPPAATFRQSKDSVPERPYLSQLVNYNAVMGSPQELTLTAPVPEIQRPAAPEPAFEPAYEPEAAYEVPEDIPSIAPAPSRPQGQEKVKYTKEAAQQIEDYIAQLEKRRPKKEA